MSLDTQQKDSDQKDSLPWSWLKSISRDLHSLDDTPLLGSAPAFPWENLAQEFAKAFSIETIKITPGDLVWKENSAVLSGVATPAFCTEIAATGIDGTVSFWMCREDVEHIMAKVLQISEVVSELQADDVVTNFHRFLGIEAICLINQLGFDSRLSFKITGFSEGATTQAPQSALCQDIKIQIGSEQMLARLVITPEFRSGWSAFFAKPESKISPDLEQVETILHLEAGRTRLLLDDLLSIRPGDLVLLDHVFYDEQSEKSHVLITLEGKTLFRAQLKDGSLTILEIPLQNEVYTQMVEPIDPATSPTNVEPEQNPPADQDEENPFPDEEEENEDEGLELIEAAAQEPPLSAGISAKAETAKAEKAAAEASSTSNTSTSSTSKPPKAIAVNKRPTPSAEKLIANDIPVELVVEVASITLSVQKLLELAPGNVVDLGLNPESSVNLVVNDRIIGKGELLKIGETIGVRILQIGV